MEFAKSAMERVPLNDSPLQSREQIPQPPADGDMREDAPRYMLAFTRPIYRIFRVLCHSCGGFVLRFISFIMFHGGILGSVSLQMLSFYNTGVLNGYVLTACLFYGISLIGMGMIRGHLVHHGSSISGLGVRMSHLVALGYFIMVIGCVCSVLQPILLRLDGTLKERDMWISIAATGLLYYCLLVSEVILATAFNVDKARIVDQELRRRDREDPAWITGYQAIYSDL